MKPIRRLNVAAGLLALVAQPVAARVTVLLDGNAVEFLLPTALSKTRP